MKEERVKEHKLSRLKEIEAQMVELKDILEGDDEELKILAREELDKLSLEHKELKFELECKEVSKNSCILEIRAGVGGEEASLFAMDLLRVYTKYAERKGWKMNNVEIKKTNLGGLKEATIIVEGDNVLNTLAYESGVHRVQRVPVTEASGRIHTSTATVAVFKEPDEIEVKIDSKDLKIDTFRASGPGGQYVNRTDTAVRITHIPTGIVVTCQDERSQYMNKMRALRVLRARIKNMYEVEMEQKMTRERKEQIGMGMRAEKVRTYNFMQNRVTDHRFGITLRRLKDIMDGDLDLILKRIENRETISPPDST